MKTLLIITSIILISFQIDRLFVHDLSFINEPIEVRHSVASNRQVLFSEEKRDLPVIEKVAIATEVQPAEALNKLPEVAEAGKPKAVSSVEYGFAQTNLKSARLHQQLKHSGNYLAMATLQYDVNEYQNIDTEAFNNILQLADKLIFDASLKVSIAGFTDITGNQDYNQKLSRLRAVNVKDYMIDLGVKESQVVVSANGITFPVADNNTLQGRAANRRVEIIVMK